MGYGTVLCTLIYLLILALYELFICLYHYSLLFVFFPSLLSYFFIRPSLLIYFYLLLPE